MASESAAQPANIELKFVTLETSQISVPATGARLVMPLSFVVPANIKDMSVTLTVIHLSTPVTCSSVETVLNMLAKLVTLCVSKPAPSNLVRPV